MNGTLGNGGGMHTAGTQFFTARGLGGGTLAGPPLPPGPAPLGPAGQPPLPPPPIGGGVPVGGTMGGGPGMGFAFGQQPVGVA